jgi:hypothetical protein
MGHIAKNLAGIGQAGYLGEGGKQLAQADIDGFRSHQLSLDGVCDPLFTDGIKGNIC